MGQLGAAAEAYGEGIKQSEKLEDTRQIASGKTNLATVHKDQKLYTDALSGYQEALALFEQLDDPRAVATIWHQIGMVYKDTRNFPKSEQAYRQSLSIESKQGNRIGEASSLNQLGRLYDDWNRPEQAVSFYRQALDIYVGMGDLRYEGSVRNNIANVLIKLQRYDEARPELFRAIKCNQKFGHVATPWNTWMLLYNLEQAFDNPPAAREARQTAVATFLAYRRDGGENHNGQGPALCSAVIEAISQNQHDETAQGISALLEQTDDEYLKALLPKLLAILRGERDLALADDEDLHYQHSGELQLLIEQLQS